MDKTLKEKIINSTFNGIDKIIENEYKNHPDEKSYSICRLQEGYDDYLKIVFKKRKIEYHKNDFFWSDTPDLETTCDELKEVERDDFVKEIVPEIKAKFEELFFKYKDSFLFRYKFSLILEFEGEEGLLKDRTYSKEFYKNMGKLMKDEENKKLLFKELENFDKYEKETILYSIWGDKWKNFIKS